MKSFYRRVAFFFIVLVRSGRFPCKRLIKFLDDDASKRADKNFLSRAPVRILETYKSFRAADETCRFSNSRTGENANNSRGALDEFLTVVASYVG